jgi:aspartyl-tRNA(Asn)/glutamyl-tRNA(Gln) amidotransferase subunit A
VTAESSLSIRALKSTYRSGEVSATAVARYHLMRIERLNPKLNAFIQVDHAGALTAAAQCDARIESGRLRALEGVPVAIKANIAVAGLEWSAGMAARRGVIAGSDAEVVSRLRAAGCIVLGTLNMHEAALGATTDNPWFGRTVNPHRPDRTPGGSSGGSGAAVAAALCSAALGTDTLGSIRIPAAYNGIYGLKPTPNRIPNDGLVLLARELDTIGPLARSLDDLQATFQVLAASAAPHSRLRRLLILDSFGSVTCEPAVMSAYQRALAGLAALPPTRLRLEDDPARVRLAGFMLASRELGAHLKATKADSPAALSADLAKLLEIGAARQPQAFSADLATLSRTRTRLREALGKDGLLLLPTSPQAAFAHTARPPASQADFTALASIAGLPALSIPASLDDQGLPVAVQLVGPPESELALLAAARTLDEQLQGYEPPPTIDTRADTHAHHRPF